MADVIGARNTDNVEQAQRVIDMHEEILLLEPDASPLTVILKRLNREKALDPLYSWFNDELQTRFDAINDATPPDAAATTLIVDNAVLFPLESLVKVPRTQEVILVTDRDTGANTIDVVRGVGASVAADFVDDDPLMVLAIADDEGSTSVPAETDNPVKVDNYTQIFKTTVEASGSWRSSSNITNTHDWAHQQKKKGIEHMKSIELAFLYGSPSADEVGVDGPRRTTGGVLHFLTENSLDVSGGFTETEWEDWLRTLFRFGSKKKTVFASPLLVSRLNEFSASDLQTSVGDESWGVKVMKLMSAHGEVTLVKHNLLEGAVYGGYGIALDFGFAPTGYKYLNGSGPGDSRDTRLLTNRQENDRDGRKDEYLTECGLKLGLPKAHGTLTGTP